MRSVENIRIGEIIEQLVKKEPGLNITRLADELNTNRGSLDNIVSHGAIPRGLITAVKIAQRFDLSLDQVVFGDSQKQDSLPDGALDTQGQQLPKPVKTSFDRPLTIQIVIGKEHEEQK